MRSFTGHYVGGPQEKLLVRARALRDRINNKLVFGPVDRVCLNRLRCLLERCSVRPAFCSACKSSAPGAGGATVRVGCDQKSLATLVFALAVPHARVHSSTRRSAWSRRPPGELGGDVRSAVLSLAPSTRGHLQVATTSSSRGLRATAGSTGTHSMRYFKAGCSRVAERGTGSHAALIGFSPTFSWGVPMKCRASAEAPKKLDVGDRLHFATLPCSLLYNLYK